MQNDTLEFVLSPETDVEFKKALQDLEEALRKGWTVDTISRTTEDKNGVTVAKGVIGIKKG